MSSIQLPSFDAILFDLDGTLADTAADLGAAVNLMRAERDLPPLPIEQLRRVASAGARGMLQLGLGIEVTDANFEDHRQQFLANYEQALCVHTHLFTGIAELLRELVAQGKYWGIVTNKPTRYTLPLLEPLFPVDLRPALTQVVCGDTTPHAKPHPAPLLYAAEQLNCLPHRCIYVGDDLRDIQAGQSAGMFSIAAGWGYEGAHAIDTWGAEWIAPDVAALLQALSQHTTQS
jgi:2-phosphoglycolate phosphatase